MEKRLTGQLDVLKKNAVDFLPLDEIASKFSQSLKTKTPLRLKIGFDPTAADIHLGHTVLLRKLRKLQDLGHMVFLIIGDFTAKIGDPSGKTALRPMLSDKEIQKNAGTYTSQAFKILDKKRTKVIYNSVWYKKMTLTDFLPLLKSYTVARMLERDDFSKRFSENKPLALLELIYPLIQGYDSVMCDADIEFGGTDQKFNLLVGRHLQEVFNKPRQGIVTMPILVGLDGENKMSKSLNNYIGVTESSGNMFGKIMSISDESMKEYYKLLTDISPQDYKELHPKAAKINLAKEIISFYFSKETAQKEHDNFESVFSKKQVPEKMVSIAVFENEINLIDIFSKNKIVTTNNEARRLIQQGSVAMLNTDGSVLEIVKDQILRLKERETILKIGKKRFIKIVR
ncbi:MAG: tyrosine--tRNA ligase [Candidatus Omnitrophica bacterium]|nr:tyrosine--tRNA ligase [Candidatus Omnitrophota bacterium]